MIDFSHLPIDALEPDWTSLLALLRSCQLVPVAIRGANAAWIESAQALGLVEAPVDAPRVRPAMAVPVLTEIVSPQEVKQVAPETVHESVPQTSNQGVPVVHLQRTDAPKPGLFKRLFGGK
jgi:septum site-determining protein MinC